MQPQAHCHGAVGEVMQPRTRGRTIPVTHNSTGNENCTARREPDPFSSLLVGSLKMKRLNHHGTGRLREQGKGDSYSHSTDMQLFWDISVFTPTIRQDTQASYHPAFRI